MSERSYMSIGDVLTLLREEFPDITISKIRFLESRGLLVPERTPSGYRKFYDHDVDRLRWILRQQREHFLPLKVIKGRLEGNDPGSERQPLFEMGGRELRNGAPVGEGAAPSRLPDRAKTAEVPGDKPGGDGRDQIAAAAVEASTAAVRRELRRVEESVERLAGSRSASAVAVSAPPGKAYVPQPGGRPNDAALGAGNQARRSHPAGAAAHPSSGPVRNPGHVSNSRNEATMTEPSRSSGRSPAEAAGGSVSDPPVSAHSSKLPSGDEEHAMAEEREATEKTASRSGVSDKTDAPSAARAAVGHADEEPRASRAGSRSRRPEEALSRTSGAAFTAHELANASGLSVEGVEQLESFGLVAGRNVAGVHCYDEKALEVAAVAAHFARFGVEARHLRLFKHAAERQAGLYSQIVMPVLRQRNPDARKRAAEELDRLAELGAELQSSFVRAMLRDMTGG